MTTEKPMVGVIDADKDLGDIMEMCIQQEGFNTSSEDFNRIKDKPARYPAFLTHYEPRVLVMDVPNPYKSNWEFIEGLIGLAESEGRGFVLTTTGKARVEQLIGINRSLEIVEKPFDLDDLARKVIDSFQSHKRIVDNS